MHISNNESKLGKSKGHALSATVVKIMIRINQMQALARKKKIKERSEEHTSELQSRETISYAVFCLKKKKKEKRRDKLGWM